MSGYNELKSSINRVIKTNDNREITGQILQNTLNSMVNSLGANYHFSGFASPITNPGTPDQNIFYITSEEGLYTNFDRIELGPGLSFLLWRDNQWSHETLSIGDATRRWVSDNFVTKEFFRSMFKAYDNHGVEIEPNNDGDVPFVIDNIKAMVGFWTDQYLNALGQGPGGGGGGGGSNSLAGLTDDVAINPQTLAGGQALIYNGTTHKWENGNAVINMSSVWSALSASTNEQINASHLSAALQGFATQEWVGQNYVSIGFFSRLFQAHGTENNQQTDIDPNDMDSTITSIEAMFGFWTEQYLNALGSSGGGSVSLTLANMGDVTLNNLDDGQILVYDAIEGKWVNTSASIVGNYLPLTGGTLTGNLFFQGYNSRLFGIKLTGYATGQPVGTNIDVGWDWDNKDGAGAFFRSSDAGTQAGDFGIFARNANGTEHTLRGKYDGTLTWGNANVLTSANIKTINGQSIYGTGDIEVGGGASGNYLPLSGGTLTNSSFGGALTVNRSTAGRASVIMYSNSGGALGSLGFDSSGNPVYWPGSSSATADKVLLASQTWANGQFLPLTGGTLSGRLTIDAGVLNITGETGYAQGIRIHDSGGYSSIFFRCTAATGNNNGMWGITAYSSGLGIRGTSSTSSSTLNYYLSIAYGGNVGIGTTSPHYKLHVNGTIGAGDVVVENLESEGYVSALSDRRKKKVAEYMDGLTIEQIADAPIIKFTWIDRPENGLQVGSIAQYWEKVLPQSVHKSKKDYLSFSYGVAALVSSVSTARKVVDHEKRIAELERENQELKMKLNIA